MIRQAKGVGGNDISRIAATIQTYIGGNPASIAVSLTVYMYQLSIDQYTAWTIFCLMTNV
jgi:hypothetical protein